MAWPTQIDAPDALASNDFLEVGGTIIPIPATLTTGELTAAFGAPNMSVSRSFGTTRQLRSDDALGDAATIVYSGYPGGCGTPSVTAWAENSALSYQ